ncbi:MAG: methyl-accepting chemotaxis protein [Aquipseudomonas alcaligenes]|uniref:Methyl-accepting chemotaxis protein n=1 Tax=Aquipseudomonas alcaligenes TaxID=43263 RepID=A0A5C7W4I1_AQUAC|nr:MAG: methyl-accepting chemotaxis protein [Pseudomonas alcaligenes]
MKITFGIRIKIALAFAAGFFVIATSAALALFNGQKIQETTVLMAENRLPGLVATAALNTLLEERQTLLYELYATNDAKLFAQHLLPNDQAIHVHLNVLQAQPELSATLSKWTSAWPALLELQKKSVATLTAGSIDWDLARDQLSAYRKDAKVLQTGLNESVAQSSRSTLEMAANSSSLTRQLMWSSGVAAGLSLVVFVLALIFLERSVSSPLRLISERIQDIANKRDLTAQLASNSHDEVGAIAFSVNQLLSTFRHSANTFDATAHDLSRVSQELAERVARARASATHQLQDVGAIHQVIAEVTDQVTSISNDAAEASNAAEHSQRCSLAGQQTVQTSRDVIVALSAEVLNSVSLVEQLDEDAQQVGTVLQRIRSIAQETNMLALNAAIEAARAGEAGRGFAVVADEVRKLANTADQSTNEIDVLLAHLTSVTQETVSVMRKCREGAGTSVQRADEAQTKLSEILNAMQDIRSINQRIDGATRQHQSAMLDIRGKASNIGDTAQEIDQLAQLLSDSASQLEQRATTLNAQLAELHY